MSEWLYKYVHLEPRLKVLGSVIKKWASSTVPTLEQNFVMVLMMIFFLQNQKIIPTLNDMLEGK